MAAADCKNDSHPETTALLSQPFSRFDALLAVQAALRRRDSEIGRLGAQVERGRDVDGLVMHHRNETNESIILQLNQQVGVCSCCWRWSEPHTLACACGLELGSLHAGVRLLSSGPKPLQGLPELAATRL